jgi:MFS family permease
LFLGLLASMFGNQLTIVAVAYEVYLRTHSSFWVGAVSLAQLPFLVAGSLWGGSLGDRTDRRPILIVATVILSVSSAGLAVNATWLHANLVLIFVFSVMGGFFGGFANATRNAAIPRLVGPDRLVAAYSFNQIGIQTASVAGPALGGILIAFLSVASCFWIDAGTFLLLTLAAWAMSPLPPLVEVTHQSLWASVADGFRYVRAHVPAQCVYLIDLNAMIFGMPTALFPAIALTWYHGGSITYGVLVSAPAVGALLGGLTTGWVEKVSRRGRAVVWAVIGWGVAIVGFGCSPSLVLGVVFLAVAGFADVISAILRNTILQSTITDDYRGRLSAIQIAVVQGGPRLGNFEAGSVAALTSNGFSVISGGVACVLGAVALARWRRSFLNA